MGDTSVAGHRASVWIAVAVTVLLVVAGTIALFVNWDDRDGPALNSGTAQQAPAPSAERKNRESEPDNTPTQSKFGPVLSRAKPTALKIPSIGLHNTDMVALGLAPDGTIEVPHDPDNPGWFTPGPAPGQFGPAVIAGHVDSETGPAVFAQLGDVKLGGRIEVVRQDGRTATFIVDRVALFDKDEFPTHAVYGDTTSRAELRLITCAGDYIEGSGYASNIVVYAHLVKLWPEAT